MMINGDWWSNSHNEPTTIIVIHGICRSKSKQKHYTRVMSVLSPELQDVLLLQEWHGEVLVTSALCLLRWGWGCYGWHNGNNKRESWEVVWSPRYGPEMYNYNYNYNNNNNNSNSNSNSNSNNNNNNMFIFQWVLPVYDSKSYFHCNYPTNIDPAIMWVRQPLSSSDGATKSAVWAPQKRWIID